MKRAASEMGEKLREFIRQNSSGGGCKVISVGGERCQCPLCDIDRLVSLATAKQDAIPSEIEKAQTTTIILQNQYGKYTVEVPQTDLNLQDCLEQLVSPILKAAGYSEALVNEILDR